MDVVGLSLTYAIQKLIEQNCSYEIERTVPTRDYFKVDETNCYVLRQYSRDGVCVLTVGAKMRKEVY